MAKLGGLTWTCPACGEGCAIHFNVRPGASAYDVTGRQTVKIYPDSSAVVAHFCECQPLQERMQAGEDQGDLLMEGAKQMFASSAPTDPEPTDPEPTDPAPTDPAPAVVPFDKGGVLPSATTEATNETGSPEQIASAA